jgi:hypothetical protein
MASLRNEGTVTTRRQPEVEVTTWRQPVVRTGEASNLGREADLTRTDSLTVIVTSKTFQAL